MTVQEWADRWQRLYPGQRNPETTRHYDRMCAPFTRAHGHKRLDRIQIATAQKWAVKHPSQVRFLRAMFGKAVKAGLLESNVWGHVETVCRSTPRVPPTPIELGRLVSGARARGGWWADFADCILFTAYSGLRGGEVQRVSQADVLDAGARLVVHGKRLGGQRDPRKRTVVVFEPGRAALLRHVKPCGTAWRGMLGGPLTQDVRDRSYKSLVLETGVGASTFHGLRHFHATWLLDQGASEVDVAIQLGHRDEHGRVDPTQIRKRYGHPGVEPALARLESIAPVVPIVEGARVGEDFAAAYRRARAA